MSTVENRQQPRAPIELRVEYTRINTFFADYTRNLSKGGMFIKTAAPLPVGTQFKFQLVVPSFTQPVSLAGEVTWTREAAEDGSDPGMGIRFLFSDPSEQAGFEKTVEGLMFERLGPEIARQLLRKGA